MNGSTAGEGYEPVCDGSLRDCTLNTKRESFLGMYRSVMLPSAISAAKNTVSDKRRMRVDGEPDILGVRAHLERENRLGDQLAGVGSDDGGAEQAARALVEDQLGQAFVAASRARASARGPREHGLLDLDALRFGHRFGQAHPRDFRIGVRHRRNGARVERGSMSGDDFGRELAFVAGLVREHRLADDVADREDVRHVRAHLLVDRDVAALVHADAGGFRADRLAIGSASHGQQHAIVDLRLRRALAFEGGLEAFLGRLDAA